MTIYEIIILLSWIAFIVVWTVAAFDVKRDIRGGYSSFWKFFWVLRLAAIVVLAVVAARIGTGTARYAYSGDFLSHGVFAGIGTIPPVLGWIAAILSAGGIAFAIWARLSLGRNWSSRPAVKEKHELVTTGPYAYVRHPIYTGVILMAFGALLTGTLFGVIVFIIACTVFPLRIQKEEQIMRELFPDQYSEYAKHTWKLIPHIW